MPAVLRSFPQCIEKHQDSSKERKTEEPFTQPTGQIPKTQQKEPPSTQIFLASKELKQRISISQLQRQTKFLPSTSKDQPNLFLILARVGQQIQEIETK